MAEDSGELGAELAKFTPEPCDPSSSLSLSSLGGVRARAPLPPLADGSRWIPVVQTVAHSRRETFAPALNEILLHPERNTSLILRAEVLADASGFASSPIMEKGGTGDLEAEGEGEGWIPPVNVPKEVGRLEGCSAVRNLVRRLVPRQPKRDGALEQDCTFYLESGKTSDGCCLVVLSPRIEMGSKLPWYHPPVRHLAFRYIEDGEGEEGEGHGEGKGAVMRVEIVPTDDASDSLGEDGVDPKSRLYRTCLALLETVYKYGKGIERGYKKRVVHDTLVPREAYQDLYLLMRDKFKDIADVWHEATDASKHVFEDISIATFLILLWRETYPAPSPLPDPDPSQPWVQWGHPPSGFLDLGCGNGLLVHILRECGYDGLGVDVRARKSWPHYPPTTRDVLFVHPFDPVHPEAGFLPVPPSESDLQYDTIQGASHEDIAKKMFPPGVEHGRFIIGNHADEMQPWVPVIAALTQADYLSIPCCAWEFDQRFQMKKGGKAGESSSAGGGIFGSTTTVTKEEEELERKMRFDEVGGTLGLYASYVLWLASLSCECGFVVESEALRIPSTRNRALIGRRRTTEHPETVRERVTSIVNTVQQRGMFKPRKPEGKAGLELEAAQLDTQKPRANPDRLASLRNFGDKSMNTFTGRFRPGDMDWSSTSTMPKPPTRLTERKSRLSEEVS